MTSAPGTVTQGVAHIKELVYNFVADIARQSPAEIFTDQARDASAPYPPRADVEYCVTLFSPPTDLWEELALDYIKELYVETVTFFLKTENNKRRTINEVHRFFIITLLCGPDRAVRSREKQDDLWEGGVPQGDIDIQSRLIFTYPANPELNQHMHDVRGSSWIPFGQTQGIMTPGILSQGMSGTTCNKAKTQNSQTLGIKEWLIRPSKMSLGHQKILPLTKPW